MIEVVTTDEFDAWLRKLKGRQGKLRTLERIDRLANGNPGDVKPVGHGVSELRLTYGPGYRVYYLQEADRLILLLCAATSRRNRRISTRRTGSPTSGGKRRTVMTRKTEKFKRFDVADYIDDLDDAAGYLEIALEASAEDPTAVPRALGAIARSQNMSELARRVGMSRDGLYKALSEEGNPTWSTILKITNALGLRFELHTVA